MKKFKCDECSNEYNNIKALSMHRSKQHNVISKLTYDEHILNGITPTCKCGCGEEPQYLSTDRGYREYIRGHASRVNNNWGHNINALTKSHITQKKMHESGELKIWNKGLTKDDPRVKDNIDKVMANPNRSKNISKKLTGKTKTEEHKQKLSKSQIKSWNNEEKREQQRQRRLNHIKNNPNKESNLEIKFKNILNELSINYIFQYPICGYMFDFYLKDFDIIIEIDGDFWHCNPNIHPTPIYESQKLTIKNDIHKNNICLKSGIKLIRIWEDDINHNLDEVVNKLKNIIQ